ncbi:hypothetical protein T440DRAFT_465231 [Plenodomus tracheiphilus IPT5]|uniref:Uncharacterized protein n=1 Tax=Plenodomus tracheiphilus IPT5 TaxID=1408161 RepID=A0A6A7BFQ1_9PLEO|nr:hypothetical protein T440DRAFT_465231 [Plenodomus tracheiphilus IPT5]
MPGWGWGSTGSVRRPCSSFQYELLGAKGRIAGLHETILTLRALGNSVEEGCEHS